MQHCMSQCKVAADGKRVCSKECEQWAKQCPQQELLEESLAGNDAMATAFNQNQISSFLGKLDQQRGKINDAANMEGAQWSEQLANSAKRRLTLEYCEGKSGIAGSTTTTSGYAGYGHTTYWTTETNWMSPTLDSFWTSRNSAGGKGLQAARMLVGCATRTCKRKVDGATPTYRMVVCENNYKFNDKALYISGPRCSKCPPSKTTVKDGVQSTTGFTCEDVSKGSKLCFSMTMEKLVNPITPPSL